MKHNNVFICGWVRELPKVVKNDATGEYVFAMGRIVTLRGLRKFGVRTSRIKYDEPLIYTQNPEMCKEIASWSIGDIVEVKGALTTKDINKVTTCPECKHKNAQPGNAAYVTPIHCYVRESKGYDKDEAYEALRRLCEISNNVTLIGVVCREPELYRKNKVKITSYQLAVRRKYRIAEDALETKTDFPWVKSFGGIGENDALVLRKGSYLFLDGWIQTRKFPRETVCECCGHPYKWNDWSLEVVPYASEYVRNCRTREELQAEEKARIEKSYKELFADEEPPQTGSIENIEEIEKELDEYNSFEEHDQDALRKLSSFEDLDD